MDRGKTQARHKAHHTETDGPGRTGEIVPSHIQAAEPQLFQTTKKGKDYLSRSVLLLDEGSHEENNETVIEPEKEKGAVLAQFATLECSIDFSSTCSHPSILRSPSKDLSGIPILASMLVAEPLVTFPLG